MQLNYDVIYYKIVSCASFEKWMPLTSTVHGKCFLHTLCLWLQCPAGMQAITLQGFDWYSTGNVTSLEFHQLVEYRMSVVLAPGVIRFLRNRLNEGKQASDKFMNNKKLRNINYSNKHIQQKNSTMLETSFGYSLSHLQSSFPLLCSNGCDEAKLEVGFSGWSI